MEQVEGCYGCRMLGRRVADAQATIAALRAEVKDLKEWLAAYKQSIELAQSSLTQHTAELEAAKADFVDASTDRDDWITSWRVLQRHNERIEAELERVRAALERIARYGNDGICPFGCDTPHIAQAALTATSQPQPPYKEWCRHPEKCAGLASCPQDPTCAD